ncbi:protein ALP1-like isoform X2 [Prunus avium]|uniref:Protein ALP1-like isoform X2 n=1 Tax=Prunus avium TaxID=42229 RepID=A0A6P5SJ93_PRUAV|nr:protein ALP1-like isoform X2 [Prunus avium]
MDRRKILLILLLELWHLETMCACTILVLMMLKSRRRHIERCSLNNHSLVRRETRLRYLDSLIGSSDIKCVNELRMDRRTFGLLCDLLRQDGRVKNDGLVSLEEQVCVFLHVLAQHVKNRTIGSRFFRSGETISRYFNSVLQGVLRLQDILLKVPDPVLDNCEDSRWRRFKNCLGALDGTYIKVRVAEIDKPRYRTRKGWEGSASDSRVLRDAITRPNGLKVPNGYYYLVDGGYTNGEGFLAPYRGTRYHLSEWRDGHTPSNHEEYFNMKHASARNVIERCFGLIKVRWGILRSPSFYPIKTQCRIITACCLLHNLIRREMSIDPIEHEINELEDGENMVEDDMLGTIGPSDQWTAKRNDMALQMYNEWRINRHH